MMGPVYFFVVLSIIFLAVIIKFVVERFQSKSAIQGGQHSSQQKPRVQIFNPEVIKVREVLARQAQKRNGILKRNSFAIFADIHIPCDDITMVVSAKYGNRNARVMTAVSAKMNVSCEGIKIGRENLVSRLGKKFGYKDIQINNAVFDDVFLIKGKDELLVKKLLGLEIQKKLLKIKDWNPYFTIHKNRFSLKVLQFLKKEEDYDVLIDLSRDFIRKLRQIGIH